MSGGKGQKMGKKVYSNKTEWVGQFIQGKNVLDLGCVQHECSKRFRKDWLHGFIKLHARSVVGVDYLEEAVKELNLNGYNVICANVESLDLRKKFDVVVAGDLIEHLSNAGKFIERTGDHLEDDGVLLITTPNPITLMRFISNVLKGNVGANSEHTCWYTSSVLNQLLRRYEMTIYDTAYINDSAQYYQAKKWRLFLALNSLFCLIFPQFMETLCFAVIKKPRSLHKER